MSRVLMAFCVVVLLACGGLGGGASPRAEALCDFLASDRACGCDAYPIGSQPVIGGLQVEVLSVRVVEGVLAVEVAYTNTTPLKSAVTVVAGAQLSNGDTVYVAPTPHRKWVKAKSGYLDLWSKPTIGPGQTKRTILAFEGPSDALDGAILHLTVVETRPNPKDPWGRRKLFTDEQLLLDLLSPMPES